METPGLLAYSLSIMNKRDPDARDELRESVINMQRSCNYRKTTSTAKVGPRTLRLVHVTRSLETTLERR